MTDFQRQLYTDLIQLTAGCDAFYFTDVELDDTQYRIFNYRLASYTNFLAPSAWECRGHMFELDKHGEFVRLAALPMEKFWNWKECPFTEDLDLSTIDTVMLKADGSLISTFIHNGELRVKSKGSLISDQAIDAANWLDGSNGQMLKAAMSEYPHLTFNLEWTAPHNRIVIGYSTPNLIVLNARDLRTGEYVDVSTFEGTPIADSWVEFIDHSWAGDHDGGEQFCAAVEHMQGIEGYVIRLKSGQHFKLKTTWYLVQHRAKDSVNTPRRLFEAVLEETTDDLRSLFHDQPAIIQTIADMELLVEGRYNAMAASVEEFFHSNKHLSRKDYAILGTKTLDRMHFGLAMNLYIGKEADYKQAMLKNWNIFAEEWRLL